MTVLDSQELCGAAALTAPACPWCLMGGVSVLHEGQYTQGLFLWLIFAVISNEKLFSNSNALAHH